MSHKTKEFSGGSDGMSDEEMVESHAELNNSKHPPTMAFFLPP